VAKVALVPTLEAVLVLTLEVEVTLMPVLASEVALVQVLT
jgi:hypothetical protein